MIDTEKREALNMIVDDLQERITVHTDVALDAIEGVEKHPVADDADAETYRMADLELKRAQVHTSLALGLRLDVLTQLLLVVALPERDAVGVDA